MDYRDDSATFLQRGDAPAGCALMIDVEVCPTVACCEEGTRPWVVGSTTWSLGVPCSPHFLTSSAQGISACRAHNSLGAENPPRGRVQELRAVGQDSKVTKVDPHRGRSELSFVTRIPRCKTEQVAVSITSG